MKTFFPLYSSVNPETDVRNKQGSSKANRNLGAGSRCTKMYNANLNNYLADMFSISHKKRRSNDRFDEDAARPE